MATRHIVGIESWPFVESDEGVALHELEALSDRAAGIVATTLLENSLESILKIRIIASDPQLHADLFSEVGLLGTLASKIPMAYALGLVTSQGKADLDTIRKIRNAFAHKLSHSTFQSDSIKDRCLNLKLVDQMVSNESGWHSPKIEDAGTNAPPSTSLIFPGSDLSFLKDARTRFFL